MNRIRNASFLFVFVILVLVSHFNMATPLLTVLFSYLALDRLTILHKKWLSISIFIVLVLCIFYGFGFFSNQAIESFPTIIANAIPKISSYAEDKGLHLPFSELESFKNLTTQEIGNILTYLAGFAKIATKEFALIFIGLVISISIYISSDIEMKGPEHEISNNLYVAMNTQIGRRFNTLYQSFKIVMGAQIMISAINAVLTGIFLLVLDLPYAAFIIILAFLVGLLPIVGNLISNTVIFFVAVNKSLWMGFAALAFLVVLHKLEYFLNGRIIGTKIRTPMWLILIILVIGDAVMGIPGMIMAPVVYYYVKMEMLQIELKT